MPNFAKALSNKAFTGALIYTAFIYLFEEWTFDFSQLKQFQVVFTFRPYNEIFIALFSGTLSCLFCYALIWIALKSSRALLCVYTISITLSALIQYGFWKAVGRFMSSVDLKIATSVSLKVWEDASALFINWKFIFPVIAFLVVVYFFREKTPPQTGLTGLVSLLVLALAIGGYSALTIKLVSLGTSISSFYETLADYTITEWLPAKREPVSHQTGSTPKNNIVLIIDESIRGDHLSINKYPRQTTPFLDKLAADQDILNNWGTAVAGGTCSSTSNSLILTGVRPGIDDFQFTETYPTIFQYGKSMGYTTYYIDAQTNVFWNGLTEQDVSYLDFWIKANDLGNDMESDFRAADQIVSIVSQGVGNLIVLNKRGVHFLYENSYPPEAGIWRPLPENYAAQPELAINPYDNGIRYNVNTFFERLLSNSNFLENTTILYTSDHGQTLFEKNVNWAHCNFTNQEASVPLLIIGENLPLPDTSFHASHSNILPTLLDLMDVPSAWRKHEYAPSLLSATSSMSQKRFFFDGALRLVEFLGP